MAARVRRQIAIQLNKEPVSAYTHFAGFAAALVAVVPLIILSTGDTTRLVGTVIYSCTLLMLFLSSSAYHYFDLGEPGNTWLQRFDHGAIFLFIAGCYIPPLLCTLGGAWRIAMIGIVGVIAVGGTILKFTWIDCPRWLSVGLYLGMGWIVVVPGWHVLPRLAIPGFEWLVIGGLSYTVGAFVYARQSPDPLPGRFGYHDLWHLFVLAGAASHYVFMLFLVRQPFPPL
jgi:hemolysin III